MESKVAKKAEAILKRHKKQLSVKMLKVKNFAKEVIKAKHLVVKYKKIVKLTKTIHKSLTSKKGSS